MTKTYSRREQIDFLLRHQFGSLAPPPAPTLRGLTSPSDSAMERARVARARRVAGIPDQSTAIDAKRVELQAMPDDQIQKLVDEVWAETRRAAAEASARLEAQRSRSWPYWAKQDLWSHAEFAAICIGRPPEEPNRTDFDHAAINRASESIARGTHSGTLPFLSRDDEDTASRLYGNHRHYRPVEAAIWARKRFDRFPAALLDALGIGERDDAHDGSALDLSSFPQELRAAIEAYQAVSSDSRATAGKSPRAALRSWLSENRSAELGANAIDRIATIANWQPSGGAPKTPG
jgi:hypothetical protein